eukprot:COSAG06_NODE_2611_length_6581_cov_21.257443_9_plen_35_part_00
MVVLVLVKELSSRSVRGVPHRTRATTVVKPPLRN